MFFHLVHGCCQATAEQSTVQEAHSCKVKLDTSPNVSRVCEGVPAALNGLISVYVGDTSVEGLQMFLFQIMKN